MHRTIFFFCIFLGALNNSAAYSDSTYWNREFHLGTTVFLSTRALDLANYQGSFRPGISTGYALKKINQRGNGFILNLGLSSFSWKSSINEYSDSLSLPTVLVETAKEFSLFRSTFLHLAGGYYKRIYTDKFIWEVNVSGGFQFLSFSRFRDIRKFHTGAQHNLSDVQQLEMRILPTAQLDARIGYRVDKKHILFFRMNYTSIIQLKPVQLYSFMSFDFGLNKDFKFKPRKLKTGHRYRDNYIYLEALGMAEYGSVNYERNISKVENFRLNIRAGFGYYESYDFISGINLVLGNRFERFEISTNYSYRLSPKNENETEQVYHIIATGVAYRAETLKNWLFKLSIAPQVILQEESHQFGLRFGASVGKRFGKK